MTDPAEAKKILKAATLAIGPIEHFTIEGAAAVSAILRILIEQAGSIAVPALYIYHGEATNRQIIYVDDVPAIVATWLRVLAARIEKEIGS